MEHKRILLRIKAHHYEHHSLLSALVHLSLCLVTFGRTLLFGVWDQLLPHPLPHHIHVYPPAGVRNQIVLTS